MFSQILPLQPPLQWESKNGEEAEGGGGLEAPATLPGALIGVEDGHSPA